MKIFEYDITDSTNTRAREYAKECGAELPAVFVANGQSAGRGRRGRSFDSERGAGLYISFLFEPSGGEFDPVSITVRAAVALCFAIKKVCGIEAGIKWVNDIYLDGRKLAGILAEGEFDADGKMKYAVCGIGVNILSRPFPPEIADIATALEDHLGYKPDAKLLREALISEFFRERTREEIMMEYRRLSTVIGRTVEVRTLTGESFTAFAEAISDGGELSVRCDDGRTLSLISAEVSVKLK